MCKETTGPLTGLLRPLLFIIPGLFTRYAVLLPGPGAKIPQPAPLGAEGAEGVALPFSLFPADGTCDNHENDLSDRYEDPENTTDQDAGDKKPPGFDVLPGEGFTRICRITE